MEFTPTTLALIGLLLAAWTAAAAWLMIVAGNRSRKAEGSRKAARRMARMIDEAPAIPLIVRTDGRIEGSDRLAGWLGLQKLPTYLSELDGGPGKGLSTVQLSELTELVKRAQKTAAPFQMTMTVPGSERSLALKGVLADPQVSPGGAALVWVFDFSESESELTQLREDAARARGDFAALVGLIEAAPLPMWFRGPDAKLRLVNKAYVDAVGAPNPDVAVAGQMELVEKVDGLTAAQIAKQASEQNLPFERIVTATIDGQRRSLRVSDLPLGKEGVAGYAVDIEEMEEQAREFRAFREAQRSILDQLSIGVGQFDAKRQLVFANQPFRRIFKLNSGVVAQKLGFEQFLSNARESGSTPEVRDFPAWRADHSDWFVSDASQDEQWPLSDGTHLRIVAQPMPDGGLVLIAEDQTEQLALSATRDTLLRTRTATFDSLFEALAVFAPDGHLQLWNRSFAGTWGLEPEMLDGHPTAEELLTSIAPNLAKPGQAKGIGEVIRTATLDRREKGGRIALADGRTLEFAGVPLPDGNGLLTVLDVTANEQAESALRERAVALEEADAVKTRFLANMSYEFRTPLTSIGGFAELLQAGVAGDLGDQGREYVQAILDSVARLTEQVENVLDLSQSEAGLLPLAKEDLELFAFVTDIVRAREEAILKSGVSLDLRGSKASGRVSADPRQLGRAIGHLLDNAIDATAKGGKILVDLSKRDGVGRIVVSDNGRGMTQDELSRAMSKLPPGGDLDDKRQGLGIPLARQLVEAHGGTLELVSQRGAGTTATILLP
ncbi:MAG: PAS-domain containing protein [Sphingomonadaceae bacterium]|nr:PAS-domain containing protein [Sphingomonadaceae bacterium]MCC0011775.1 PAS-domain containing protein [Rhodobiaceae bacterium]MCP5384597.1 PAS-domain containing protein [Altererythrobacter sp.]MCP5394841.1 PAS-domain containing protein [Sphingomonadaceae bacterium]